MADGLSGAASIIGVISLVIQLTSKLQDLRKRVEDIKNAPKELLRLVGLSSQLEHMLDQVQRMLKEHGDELGLSPGLSEVSESLDFCKDLVASLTDFVNELAERLNPKNKTWRLVKEKNRMASLKGDIERMERDVHNSIAILQVAISTCNSQVSLTLSARTSNLTRKLSSLNCHVRETTLATKKSFCRPQSHVEGQLFTILRNGLLTISYDVARSHLGTNRPNDVTYSEETRKKLTALFPLLGKGFDVHVKVGLGRVQHSLTTYAVKEQTSAVFLMCKVGDIQELQRMFTSRSASPFTVDTNGRSLLHYAVRSKHATNVCRFLLDRGIDVDRRDVFGRTALQHWSDVAPESLTTDPDDTVATIRTLVQSADLDFTRTTADRPATQKFSMPFFGRDLHHHLPLVYESMVGVLLSSLSLYEIEDQYVSPLSSSLRQFGFALEPQWGAFVHKLLRMGFDVHGAKADIDGTPLDNLFLYSKTPADSVATGKIWLAMLAKAGFDVNEYLRREVDLHPGYLVRHTVSRSRLYVFDHGNPPAVSWIWADASDHTACELFQEFGGLNLACGTCWEPNDSRKDESGPFIYPKWQRYDYWSERNWRPWMDDPYDDTLRRRSEARIQRRQLKRLSRLTKNARVEKSSIQAIPGAWIP
ncbi:hypothetical protein Q7P37_003946 [Cladosporium fusiforme]